MTMTLLIAAYTLLLMVSPCLSSVSGKSILSYPQELQGARAIAGELIHRYHVSSPFLDEYAHLTRGMKIEADVLRSKQRSSTLQGKAANVTQSLSLDGLIARLYDYAPYEYLMKISLGTPAQSFVAVVDSGSDISWLKCDKCRDQSNGVQEACDTVFVPRESLTFSEISCASTLCTDFQDEYYNWTSCKNDRCQYIYLYQDNSSSAGPLVTDILHMTTTDGEEIDIPDFAFGCGRENVLASDLFARADGMLGLGRGMLSFPSQLGPLFGKKFSYCLVTRDEASIHTSSVWFGDDAVPNIPGVQYIPLIYNQQFTSYYYVGLTGISVGGSPLEISPSVFAFSKNGEGGTIVDSGTTYSTLVSEAYLALLFALFDSIPYPTVKGFFDLCYDVTDVANIVAPSIAFNFENGAELHLPFENAFNVFHDDNGNLSMCLAMNNASTTFSIIGNVQQANHQILYDLEYLQIGFVPRQCSN